jgi:environmental stress-induced protein Ves
MGEANSRVIPANEYRRVRWKNDLGWTREIACWPDQGDWDWRLSIAEIERDAEFSPFPGIERELVLLSGNGLRLVFDDGETRELHPPHDRLRFAGERGVRGELLDGPTHDFNLMWRRGRIDAQLWHRPLVGSMLLFAEPRSIWALHVLAGQARLQDGASIDAAQGDTLLLPGGPDGRRRYPLDGGGELLVIRVLPIGTPDADGFDAAG